MDAVKDIYDGVVTNVRTVGGKNNTFSITIGLCHDFYFVLYLFALVIDDTAGHTHDEVLWCLLFTDDVILKL